MITIVQERPDTPAAMALIGELEESLAQFYPVESRHGLSVMALLDQGVDFFVARHGGAPAGCGGVLFVGDDYGEIKRMYVRPAFRGQGIGLAVLQQLEAHARQRGLPLLRLETGIHQQAAIRLYERCGFSQIPPFGPYRHDPLSLCYEKGLPPH